MNSEHKYQYMLPILVHKRMSILTFEGLLQPLKLWQMFL